MPWKSHCLQYGTFNGGTVLLGVPLHHANGKQACIIPVPVSRDRQTDGVTGPNTEDITKQTDMRFFIWLHIPLMKLTTRPIMLGHGGTLQNLCLCQVNITHPQNTTGHNSNTQKMFRK